MSSELRVDKIIPTTGVPTGGGGGVIQVVQTNLSSTFSTTSTSFVDVTDFNVTITPKFSTSKILVIVSCRCNQSSGSNVNARTSIDLRRGSTQIMNHYVGHFIGNSGTNDNNNYASVNICKLDSPATTSATTYKVQLASDAAACTSSITGGTNPVRSTILAMEVSA